MIPAMTRVRRPLVPPEQIPLIAETTPAGVERSRRKSLPPAKMRAAAYEVEARIKKDEWAGARPLHLVALYMKMHLEVYGVEATDCGPTERLQAAGVAGKMLERDFEGDVVAMVDFIRWVWRREVGAEKWRRENHRSGRRISWPLQFSQKLFVDYRIDWKRRAGR